ncbi:hypothetical protein RYZ26_08075 [Terasakiella sp. A23]|uniref:hypothetical protein n=1 Tax=Terasakiella sp. FCG-A23 TaxID=3080561 RepID=UPI0029541F4A|nr:hypothetical protein [Terasakiella sp. A23]MDV7339545.1 hypothetical protein [Terasakiella sp. A23]
MSEAKPADFEKVELTTAMTELSSLKPEEGKAAMMTQVDGAAQRVLKVLAEGDPDALQKGTYLTQIRFVLTIMEQCKEFRDGQFTRLVRQRAEEIMTGLENLPKRSKELKEQKKREAAEAKKKTADAKNGGASDSGSDDDEYEVGPDGKKRKKKKKPKEPEFPYELAEKICIQSVVRHFDSKLDVLRSTHLYGRHSINDIGIAPLFLYSIEFSVLIEDAIKALIMDSREILTRRVYNETDPEADEEKIRSVLRDKQRPLLEVVESGFSGWGSSQTEAAKRAAQGDGPKKKGGKQEKKGGLFSKLLGKEKKAAPAPKKAGPKKKETWEKVMDIFKEAEARDELFFPKTFNFSILSYLSNMRENLFKGEVERIIQIAEQASQGPNAKGAVARALEQSFKNNDQNFFEMLILNLLYTKNAIGLDEVQGACMGQKLDEGRLPLSVPEMGRRPITYANQIVKLLKAKAEPRVLQNCLEHFFEAILVLHLIKYEADFTKASQVLEGEKANLPKPLQGVVDGILALIDRVIFARQQARETGEDTSRNTRDNIEHTIGKFMTAYKGMHEKMSQE